MKCIKNIHVKAWGKEETIMICEEIRNGTDYIQAWCDDGPFATLSQRIICSTESQTDFITSQSTEDIPIIAQLYNSSILKPMGIGLARIYWPKEKGENK